MKITENNKKRSPLQIRSVVSFRILVWVGQLFVFMFTPMHALNFMFWVCVICANNKFEIIVWVRIINLQSLEKGISWKSWLDPRFPRNSKSKWTLKWLPPDRGYFKFYFHKGGKLLIISCHTFPLIRKFIMLFQVIFVLSCILFSLICPVIC